MSRIGKRPVSIPSGVSAEIADGTLNVKGPKGTLPLRLRDEISYTLDGDAILVKPANDSKAARAFWGMQRTMVDNLVTGVTQGYTKVLEINGVGYRAEVKGKELVLSLGYSHQVNFPIPEGIAIEVEKMTKLSVKGYDKEVVGQTAAKIRSFRGPEPYKGKGIKYANETILRKAGKTGKK